MAALRVPQVSQLLAGKYRIERHLGEGGMGYVVAARHVELDELVAIKLVHPSLLHNTPIVERFLREAKRLVRLKSEHVVRVFDVDRTEEGQPFIVMEYLDGCDLSAIVRGEDSAPRVRTAVVVDWMLQAMDAIAEAHALGIVHRDLKPANLFVAKNREGSLKIKVVDFGISKALTEPTGHEFAITRTRDVVGSPPYMSPEQMSASRNVDGRTDIWSLGVIFYRLLAGRLPFDGESLPEVFAKVYASEPPRLRSVAPHVPPGLDEIVHRCLVKARDQRMPSVCELARALAPHASPASARTLARIATFASSATMAGHRSDPSLAAQAPIPQSASPSSQPRRTRVVWPFVVAAVVVLGAIGAWKATSLWRARTSARSEAASAATATVSAPPEDVPPPPTSSAEIAPATSVATSASPASSARSPKPPIRPAAPPKTTAPPKPAATPASSSGSASDRHG